MNVCVLDLGIVNAQPAAPAPVGAIQNLGGGCPTKKVAKKKAPPNKKAACGPKKAPAPTPGTCSQGGWMGGGGFLMQGGTVVNPTQAELNASGLLGDGDDGTGGVGPSAALPIPAGGRVCPNGDGTCNGWISYQFPSPVHGALGDYWGYLYLTQTNVPNLQSCFDRIGNDPQYGEVWRLKGTNFQYTRRPVPF